jgi:hypothetical protein
VLSFVLLGVRIRGKEMGDIRELGWMFDGKGKISCAEAVQ